MTLPELMLLRAEQRRIGAAIRRSTLDGPDRLILWTIADQVVDAAENGTPDDLSMTDVAEQTGLQHYVVARQIATLIDTGWLTRNGAGAWVPTIPATTGGRA